MSQRTIARALSLCTGALVSIVAWWLLVPSNLSEIDELGHKTGAGLEGSVLQIAVVALLVTCAGLAGVWVDRSTFAAAWFVTGGLGAWCCVLAWAGLTARTSGANLFVVPLTLVVLPVTALVPCGVALLERRQRSTARHSSQADVK
jgi:hypothetical protein